MPVEERHEEGEEGGEEHGGEDAKRDDEFFIEASLFKELKTVGAVKLMKSEQNLKKAIKMILSGYGICYTWQFIGVSQKSFSSLLEMIKSIPWVRSLRNVK